MILWSGAMKCLSFTRIQHSQGALFVYALLYCIASPFSVASTKKLPRKAEEKQVICRLLPSALLQGRRQQTLLLSCTSLQGAIPEETRENRGSSPTLHWLAC